MHTPLSSNVTQLDHPKEEEEVNNRRLSMGTVIIMEVGAEVETATIITTANIITTIIINSILIDDQSIDSA